MNKLQAWYDGLQQREQRMVSIGGVVVAVMILLFGILLPLQSAAPRPYQRPCRSVRVQTGDCQASSSRGGWTS